MIDLHLHLLPDVDDGASSVEDSHAMIARAKELGFTNLIATPHLEGVLTPEYLAAIEAGANAVDPIAAQYGVEVGLGFENRLTPDIPARLERGEPITLDGSMTVLVELPFAGWPLHTEQTLFNIQAAGFRALLAHPERYATFQDDPDRALDLAERGVLMQVTTGALVGLFGRAAQRLAEELLVQDAVAVLATDAHSDGQRLTSVTAGLERARRLVGEERVRQLTVDNPRAILDDKPLPTPAEIRPEAEPTNGWRQALRRLTARAGFV
ncbi:MAG TPA: CpsB/CapC family capsule biosynthesis tyrosine phosphatase [Thermomicrobiales bacterium]